jgi:hypothetical protein
VRDPRDDLEDARADVAAGLFLSRRGNWFHDGERVRHERLARLLSGSIAREDGALIVTTGRDRVPFVAEDAPLFVLSVDVDDAAGITLLLSDQSREPLVDVVVGPDDRLRAVVRSRAFWALFTRSAGQLLEPFFVDDDVLSVGAHRWQVRARSADWSAPPALR